MDVVEIATVAAVNYDGSGRRDILGGMTTSIYPSSERARMSKHEIAVLCSRVLALWLLAQALAALGSLLGTMLYIAQDMFGGGLGWKDLFRTTGIIGTTAIVFLWMAWFFWQKAHSVARLMVADLDPVQGTESQSLHSISLLSVALAVVGTYVTVMALAPFLSSIVELLREQQALGSYSPLKTWRSDIIADFVRMALGVWLMVGSKGIARMISKARGDIAQDLSSQ